jgi:hypothetical protein
VAWLDYLFGPPNRDKFARLVMAELAKLGPATTMRYDAEQFLIERGSEGFINLANLYQEYCQVPRRERGAVLDRFIRGCVGTTEFELPSDFEDVHPDLLPVVRSRFYLESVGLQSRARGGEDFTVPQQFVGDHLSLSLVYDLPQAMRSIIQEDLDRWGVTLYEAVEAARRNLEQMGNVAFASLQSDSGDGVYFSATGDNYDASRLVMLDLIRKFQVRGDYIAMVPNRDTLVVTGSEDEGGLAVMIKAAEDSFDKPRPISTIALRLEGDSWESWLPERSSPHFAKFHELKVRTVGMEYNDQKELLDQIHDRAGEDLFVATFNAVQRKDSGAVSSYGIWAEGTQSLLPETDDLLLLRGDPSAKNVEVAASGSWQRVREIVGDLMQPMGLYPERYRVAAFPTAKQLAAIGKGDWPLP